MRSFCVFFVVSLNKMLKKQSSCRWYETPYYNTISWMESIFTNNIYETTLPRQIEYMLNIDKPLIYADIIGLCDLVTYPIPLSFPLRWYYPIYPCIAWHQVAYRAPDTDRLCNLEGEYILFCQWNVRMITLCCLFVHALIGFQHGW